MTRIKSRIISALAILLLCALAHADVLELKNGKTLRGQYLGGTASTVRFDTGSGIEVVETSQAVAITFSGGEPAVATPARATPAAPVSAPRAATPQAVQVPAGSLLLVRLDSAVSSGTAAGQRFSCKLETDLVADGHVVARAGTPVYGRVAGSSQAGRIAGKSSLSLTLTEINLGGQAQPIATGDYSEATRGEFRNTARNAAMGAAVGAAFDGGSGARRGAAIGGAASMLRKGDSVSLPAGSLLEFRLNSGFTTTVR
jgi:hypothetical protein